MAASMTTPTLEKHLKDIICIHTTMSTTSLVNFFQIVAFIVHFAFFLIAQHRIAFANVFKTYFSFFDSLLAALLMLIGMPLDSLLAVSFFNFSFIRIFADVQNSVVVLAFRLFEFQLRVL